MPPEVKMERVSTTRNFTVIRATPAQTTLLRASYAHSNIASREQLAELSEQTGLPQKWIHQWFGRQRSKDRRGRPNSMPGAVSNRSGSPSSIYSQDSILKIKSESGDPGVFLSSSETPSGSEYLGTVSASSSIVIEPDRDLSSVAPSTINPTTRKKRKGAETQTDMVSTANTRTLRSRTRKGAAAQGTLVKKELVEEALLDNVSAAQPPSDQSFGRSRKMTGAGSAQANKIGRPALRPPTSVHHLNQAFLPMIAPAKRSPITSSNLQQGSSAVKPPSKLSIDRSDSIYAHSSGVQAHGQGDEGQASDILARFSRAQTGAPYHYDKPVFHTRFQNNRPSDFVSNNVHGLTNSKLESSMPQILDSYDENIMAEARRAAPFHLAPAFDWCNPVPTGSNSRDSKDGILASSPNAPENAKPLRFRFGKAERNPLEVAFDQVVTELDPSVAPQKHLLDILKEHRDEQGNYTVDEGLIATLLGDVPPFYKAMGLSLLSRLGLEWSEQSM